MTPANRTNSTNTPLATDHPATTAQGHPTVVVSTRGRGPARGARTPLTSGPDRPAHGPWRRLLGATLVCLCGLAPACDDARPTPANAGGSGTVTSSAPLAEQVQDLVDALAAETTGGQRQQDAWHDRVRATLERMERSDPDLGRAVLQLLDEREDLDPGLRARLLDAASRAMSKDPEAQDELAAFLASRVETYGRALGERNQACELLGEHCPEAALAVLGPLLLPDRRARTLPDREFMLRGYLTAAESTGTDAHDLLCEIALEKRLDHLTRKIALRELVPLATPRAIAVFETVMTESSGDMLLRGEALTCYTQAVPKDRAIARLEELAALEADINMQIRIANTLATLRGER